ncbi:sensor histidine kinase [Pediococcus ethanolidurans]|uniref:sensor histidine kinase n=1 Tax=Pediococcus ethanolidurans TaxID=319653 RepID=UPI001C1EDEB2|nr:HAMP domain-containing sensor histidine kinase [Pediococcus ethanolidurans]MBU7554789.1 HAMP domain-containing histidine kinase [Pediococcus ethanolidurans]MBU7562879.1 HAMP domain-containing histidine kinase [Pediococcus ethanolidurans]MCT4398788.1 sensor histidine kinase [Pediococcus ethanolidurans]MCV3315293.1 HAMP domain-containing histidine kinase [Pediococcus ethanolidurans]MCV3323297.1 HAMP domain-containing histidine kinase [Pediococcus ethanolidurans]
MKLTAREKSELLGEGFITVILLLLLNLSILILVNEIIRSNPGLERGIFQIKESITIGPNNYRVWSYQNFFIFFMAIVDVWVVYWRLMRRYKQMQLRHIIGELHYIADGHFDHRIPFTLKGDHQRVVDSVNVLVDSVIESMDEERKIEQSKDELITNVSHDLRTPLTSIIGYLGLIENQQYQNEDDVLKYTHTAFLKAQQMKSLVEDLFEYTKVRQASTKMTFNQISVEPMLEQLAASFELEAEKKNMKIDTKAKPKDIKIEGDAEKLGRLFNNLISNALKYAKGGRHINLEATQSGDQVVFKVSNDGEMIPEESIKHLFERFYRVESSRSKATGGTGLGLAIAQSIVELHHGKISVESSEKLTSFIVKMPLKQNKVNEANR